MLQQVDQSAIPGPLPASLPRSKFWSVQSDCGENICTGLNYGTSMESQPAPLSQSSECTSQCRITRPENLQEYEDHEGAKDSSLRAGPVKLMCSEDDCSEDDEDVAGQGVTLKSCEDARHDSYSADQNRQRASAGSKEHDQGRCRPCVWNWRPSGCSKGSGCEYCHLCPEEAIKERVRQRRLEKLNKPRKKRYHRQNFPSGYIFCRF